MKGTGASGRGSSAILTVPNLLSFLRILLIPVFVVLIVDPDTTVAGLILYGVVMATDWVDGLVARRTGQVSELGKVLDPTADRLAIAAGLIALVIRGVFPLWAALLVLVRDLAVLVVGAAVLSRRHIRLEVRRSGKVATALLMVAVGAIAWGNLDLWLAPVALAGGWLAYGIGIVLSYVTAALYLQDVRGALAEPV
jgi:cardiolipin synthase (CMP-forming)